MAPGEAEAAAAERRDFDHGSGTFDWALEAAGAVPIIGIGASAGGLAAFEDFFSAMPTGFEAGMAFVLVQHLPPDHESTLAALVRRLTHMRVFEAEDGMRVEANGAYIIPPNRNLALLSGTLRLSPQSVSRGRPLPIDFFFRSLARAQRDRAVGIVLSGTGTDGTLGARAIKGEGGIVIAQTPESTEYDGMPRSVIATGLVDHVLRPAEMPEQLLAYADSLAGRGRRPSVLPPLQMQKELERIVGVLYALTGHDFSQYKTSTIRRRVERRMAVQHIDQLTQYCRFLEEAPVEVEELLRDLLIGVTSFFRDPKAFEALETLVIPALADSSPSGSRIRAWVPGCSTGEEAYSIAILLREKVESDCRIQVFATDIDPRAIDLARAGVYPASIASDVAPERLARHFSRTDDGQYRVNENIRELLIFSEQDVTQDPPVSRLDIISCRNLMIYMAAELQQKLIPLFHYALNPGGTLFLGTSETVGEFLDLFATTDRQAKLYQRRDELGRVARSASERAPAWAGQRSEPSSSRRHPASDPPGPALDACLELSDLQKADPQKAAEGRLRVLTQALRAKDESFYAAREEMHTSNEEFRASIEQLQTTNEQLQTTNEQLENSKGQIQSMNEQLTTLNTELKTRMTELTRVNDDINGVLAGSNNGTIFVDREARVRRYTSAATQFVTLAPTDVGRPLRHIVAKLVGYEGLMEDVQSVLDSATPERLAGRVRVHARHHWQVRPYRSSENVIDGAVITFTEVKSIETGPVASSGSTDFGSAGLACNERGVEN
ncbi:MAG: chemotaxis protein CheB [Deltaproteobacteria bacterium]